MIFGGEALDPAMLTPWYADPRNAGTELVNMYGITETTVHVTYRPLTPADLDAAGRQPDRPADRRPAAVRARRAGRAGAAPGSSANSTSAAPGSPAAT